MARSRKSPVLVAAGVLAVLLMASASPGLASTGVPPRHRQTEPTPAAVTPSPSPSPFLSTPAVLFGARAKPRASDPVVTGNHEEDAVLHLESEIGRKLAIDHQYAHFGDLWPDARMVWDRDNGRLPLLNWAPESPTYTWPQIAAGQADSIIDARARAAAAYGGPILLAFHHEPENDTRTYGTPADYVAAWKHVVDRFRAAGATNVQFVLILEAMTFQHGTADQWYPGRSYVDYVGADGYNWFGTKSGAKWREVGDIFKAFYAWTVTTGVPGMITETGCLEDPNNSQRKAQWFANADAWLHTHPNIKAFVYFHSDQRWPWWVDTSPQSLQSFTAMGQDSLMQ